MYVVFGSIVVIIVKSAAVENVIQVGSASPSSTPYARAR